MSEPIIPYATVERRPLSGRDLFGVVVRTIGVLLFLWGLYAAMYATAAGANTPVVGQSLASYWMFTAFAMGAGGALLKGEWLVIFAYGRDRNP